jgi:hypothetical protein
MKDTITGMKDGRTRGRAGAISGGVLLLCAALVLAVGVVLAMAGRLGKAQQEADAARVSARVEKLAKLRAENEKVLHSYAWIDKDKGVVQIPIERAMELTVEALKKKEVKAAGPVAPAAPAPAPAAGGNGGKS